MKKLFLLTSALCFLVSYISFAQSSNWKWAKGGVGDGYGNSVTTDKNGNVYVTGSLFLSNNVFVAKYDAAGNSLWLKLTGDGIGNGIATDTSGNVYVTGEFYSATIFFGNDTLTSAGDVDFFIVKYDSSGNVLWAKSAGGSLIDYGNDIATDGNNNVYVTGGFGSGSITFGSFTLNNPGLFIVKYDTSGTTLWAKDAGGGVYNNGNGIATDGSGNVFVAGILGGSYITFDSTMLINSDIFGNSSDVFVVKYNSSGTALWAKSAGTNQADDYAKDIATDHSGNVYATGVFQGGSISFGSFTLNNSSTGDEVFIVKYDGVGNALWAHSAGGNNFDRGSAIATDSIGNSFATGAFESASITFGNFTLYNASPGTYDIFMVKYDTSGNALWAQSAGGNDYDLGKGIATDGIGSVYLIGVFASPSITFGSFTLDSTGGNKGFLAKYAACSDFNYAPICIVTVDSTSTKNVIVWEKPVIGGIDSFIVYRDFAGSQIYSGSVAYTDLSKFTDNSPGVNPNIQSYKYRISVKDTCGNESLLSSYHKTIHLAPPQVLSGHFILQWDNYEGFGTTNFYYRVLRDSTGAGNNFQAIDSVAYGNTQYFDLNHPLDSFAIYLMEVVHPFGGCIVTEKSSENHNSSRSNKSFPLAIPGGIKEFSNEDLRFMIYPNPTSGKIEVRSRRSEVGSLEIYNILGEKNYQSPITQSPNYPITIDLSNHPNGIYFLQVKTEQGIVNKKLIISK